MTTNTTTSNNFYIYAHYKPDGNIFYVGKGRSKRAWKTYGRSDFWYKTVNKHGGYEVVLLYENLSEDEAFRLEKEEIEFWGRRKDGGFLINLTDGGDGVSGYKLTQDQLIKHRQRYENSEYLQKITETNRRNAQTPEWKRNHKESRRRLQQDLTWHKKISEGVKKRYDDPEFHKKIAEQNRRLPQNPEWKRKQTKIRQSPEFKQKLSESIRKVTQTAEWKRNHKKAQQEVSNRPEIQEQRSQRRKLLLQDPIWYEKFLQSQEHRKQKYILLSPSGEIVHITGLNQFCKEHGLTLANISKVIYGKRNHHKGWRKYIPPDDNHLINQFTL
jgi:hypothetical protein